VAACLAAGADVDAPRHFSFAWDRQQVEGGESALHAAVRGGHAAIVELLLAHGANPDLGDRVTGCSPLVAAAARGDLRCGRALLAAGASVHAVDGATGDDAFAAAIRAGSVEVAGALAAAGVEATARAVELACHLGRVDLLAFCVAHGGVPDATAVEAAVRGGHLSTVRWLFAHGASLAATGPAALCEAANAGHAEVVAFLVGNGVPTDVRTSYGWPPLMLAAYNADAATVSVLLAAGADARADDGQGRTALDWAREADRPANVRLLEQALQG